MSRVFEVISPLFLDGAAMYSNSKALKMHDGV